MLISLVDGFLNEQIGWIIALLILSLKYEWKFFDVYLHKTACLLFDLTPLYWELFSIPVPYAFGKNYRDRSLQFCCSSHNFQLPGKGWGGKQCLGEIAIFPFLLAVMFLVWKPAAIAWHCCWGRICTEMSNFAFWLPFYTCIHAVLLHLFVL